MSERRVSEVSESGVYYHDAGPVLVQGETFSGHGRKLLAGKPTEIFNNFIRHLIWFGNTKPTEFFRTGTGEPQQVALLGEGYANRIRMLQPFEGFVKHPAISGDLVRAHEIYHLTVTSGAEDGRASVKILALEDVGLVSTPDVTYHPSNLRFGNWTLTVYTYPATQSLLSYPEGVVPYRATIEWRDTHPQDSQKRVHGSLFDRFVFTTRELFPLRLAESSK